MVYINYINVNIMFYVWYIMSTILIHEEKYYLVVFKGDFQLLR